MQRNILVQVEGEDGTSEYVPLSEAELTADEIATLPDTVVQAHPEFSRVDTLHKDAVVESKLRLRRAQAAEQGLKDDTDDDDDDNATPPPAQLSEEDRYQQYQEWQRRDVAQAKENRTAQDTVLGALMTKHGLTAFPNALDILRASNDPNTTAEQLGRSNLEFGSSSGGDVPPTNIADFDFSNVDKKLGLPPIQS